MDQEEVILGVDTHLDLHVGAVISVTGRLLATQAVPTTTAGYLQLLTWARTFAQVRRAGIEGTSSYGAGLTRFLREHGVEILEVNRPDRAARRLRGKSDTTDAESAACAVLAGCATAIPKEQSGAAYAMRAVSVAGRSAVKAKTQAINQLRGFLVSAPQDVRERLLKSKTEECVYGCSQIRSLGNTPLLQATLRLLAKRWPALNDEIKVLDAALEQLTSQHASRLRQKFGVGAQTAAVLVCLATDNPERLKNGAALAAQAALCGVSPLQASSGKTTRHRLNRGGDRSANNGLCTIAMVRMRSHPRTRAYVARRTAQGLSKKEIQRCLKRYIVRELYPLILADLRDSAIST